jgi:RNA polymerase sigma-70 factor (ECF subfamily)
MTAALALVQPLVPEERRMIGPAGAANGGLPLMDEAVARRPGPATPVRGAPAGPEATVDLVQRARTGDQAAFDELFTRYETRLRRWAHGRLPRGARGAMDTQDLVQDTLTKVFQRIGSFEPRHPGAFRDYVWTTLWNRIRDVARTQTRRGPSDSLDGMDLPSAGPSPLEEAMGSEVFARYEAAMERLRPEDREAVIARVELGLSHAEVAESLGKPSVAAAHMAVSRALVRLAEEMAHERTHRR